MPKNHIAPLRQGAQLLQGKMLQQWRTVGNTVSNSSPLKLKDHLLFQKQTRVPLNQLVSCSII